jgi:glycosyltransferase involved in cell wall biosynthesis
MKIVLIGKYNESELLSGPEKVAKRLFENIRLINSDTVFIEYFFKYSGKSSFLLRLFGSKELYKSANVKTLGILPLFFYLIKNQPDIIHLVTEERFQASIFLYKLFLKSKILLTAHGLLRYESSHLKTKPSLYSRLKIKLLEFLLFNFSDKIVFVSKKLLDFSLNYYKLDLNKTVIIPNGVDKIFFNETPKALPERSLKIVLYCGDIKDSNVVERLKIIFDNTITNMKIELFVITKVVPKDYFTDWLTIRFSTVVSAPELAEFLRDKDLYLNINNYESFSIFALECMASGIIPVVFKEVGMSPYIQNGINGFILSCADGSEELKSIVRDLIEHKKYDFSFISRNASRIVEELNWSKISCKYMDLYKALINE